MGGRVYFSLAVLLSMLVTVLASTVKRAPQKCCFPEQVSMIMTDLNSINSEPSTYMAMQIDYNAQKQVMVNYTMGSQTPLNRVIVDYNTKMLYSVVPAYPKYCYKMNLTTPLIRCVPDDAEYLGSSYLGPMGAGQMPYDGWRFSYPGGKISMAISQQGCVPIVEGVSIPAENQKQLYFFSGFEPSLKDPSAFDLPDSCK